MYHIVLPSKYRRKIFTCEVEETLKEICIGIGERYEIHFLEIGLEEDHVHFLVQSVPMYAPKDIVVKIKSISAREIFKRHPEIKKILWGGNLWTSGYYMNTVGQYASEEMIRRYVQQQGKEKEYKQIYQSQVMLFEGLF